MKRFTVIVLVLGIISCGHPFKKESGVMEVVYPYNDKGQPGRTDDPAATWHTQLTSVITDSASASSKVVLDTIYTIHKYTTDTLKDSKGAYIYADSAHKLFKLKFDTSVLTELPGAYVQPIHFPRK